MQNMADKYYIVQVNINGDWVFESESDNNAIAVAKNLAMQHAEKEAENILNKYDTHDEDFGWGLYRVSKYADKQLIADCFVPYGGSHQGGRKIADGYILATRTKSGIEFSQD